jgi:hydrogenase nickel incorporation protein HypA/HybF
MHELTIAREMVRVVKDSLTSGQLSRLKCINLLIGKATAVQEDCLRFGFEAMAKDTPLSGIEVSIEYVVPLFRCKACGKEFESEEWFYSACPECGRFGCDLLRGDELLVASVDLE